MARRARPRRAARAAPRRRPRPVRAAPRARRPSARREIRRARREHRQHARRRHDRGHVERLHAWRHRRRHRDRDLDVTALAAQAPAAPQRVLGIDLVVALERPVALVQLGERRARSASGRSRSTFGVNSRPARRRPSDDEAIDGLARGQQVWVGRDRAARQGRLARDELEARGAGCAPRTGRRSRSRAGSRSARAPAPSA